MRVAFFLAVIALLLLPAHAVFTPIKFPHTIYGIAYVNGAAAPGAVISCYINGVRHLAGAQNGATPDATAASDGGYLINVGGDDGALPKEGAVNGDTITFAINGQATNQSAVFSSGGTTQIALYTGAPPAPPPAAPPSGSGSNPQNSGSQNQNNPPQPPAPPPPPANSPPQNNSSNPSSPAANNSQNNTPPRLPASQPAANESGNSSSFIQGMQGLFAGNSSNSSQEPSLSRKDALLMLGLSALALFVLFILFAILVAILFFVWKKLQRGGL